MSVKHFFSGVVACVDAFPVRFHTPFMQTNTGKRTAKVRTTLTKRVIEALDPTDTSWIAWDDKLTGFGIRVHPGGGKSFIVNYRAGDGGRKAPNKRLVIGRYGKVTADQARRQAQKILGKVADGDNPAEERAEARSMPTLGDTFEEYMIANPNRSKRTNELYRYEAKRYLGDWLSRPLDAIARKDVETRFNSITADHGWSAANRAMSLLRSVYRRPCVDLDGLRNPVDLWLAGGGKFHRKTAAQDLGPGGGAAVLARRDRGGSAQPGDPGRSLVRALHRHAPRGGAHTPLGADRPGNALTFRVEETKTGVPLELPITRQLAAILERRLAGDRRPACPAFATGCFPRPPAPPAMCRISTISTAASARPAAPSSGSTACGTASSPSPSAN